MMVIAFEGYDGTGKTTLIEQLTKKYPGNFESYHFPSPESLDKIHKAYQVFAKKKTLDNLLKYHVLFLEDFANHQQTLLEYNNRDKILLLDRYIYSHAAYANADLVTFFIHNPRLEKNYYGYCKKIMKIFYSFYSELKVTPDLVIFLERSPLYSNAPEELKTNFFYSLNFKDYAPKRVESVRALTKNTLPRVINIINKLAVELDDEKEKRMIV